MFLSESWVENRPRSSVYDYDLFLILCTWFRPTNLMAVAGNTSHIKIFLILCIQFVLCMNCQFMKKKDMSPLLIFHNLTLKFQHFTNFLKKKKKKKKKKKRCP